ncbi:Protein kinase domain-containing protein [Forsythia ovata]|uniref:Protein kinase domain-containing protein n=1 Tax=Forsythia ovata TaxID=205694 RepID=A0ABD1XF66_9LAMI
MIDSEIASLVPEWKKDFGIDKSPNHTNSNCCQDCASNGSLVEYLSVQGLGKNLQVLHCSKHECGAIHGRFEEITYQFEGSEQCVTEGTPLGSSQSDGVHCADIWSQHEGPELVSNFSGEDQKRNQANARECNVTLRRARISSDANPPYSNIQVEFTTEQRMKEGRSPLIEVRMIVGGDPHTDGSRR